MTHQDFRPPYTPAWTRYANAYLPVNGQPHRKTADDVVAHRMKFQKTPIFDELNSAWTWLHYFSSQSRKDLIATAEAVGIHTWRSMPYDRLLRELAMHFQKRIEDMSRGNG